MGLITALQRVGGCLHHQHQHALLAVHQLYAPVLVLQHADQMQSSANWAARLQRLAALGQRSASSAASKPQLNGQQTPLTFQQLGVHPMLVAGLRRQEVLAPTPVQAAAFQPLLQGSNTAIQSPAGTGKVWRPQQPQWQQQVELHYRGGELPYPKSSCDLPWHPADAGILAAPSHEGSA